MKTKHIIYLFILGFLTACSEKKDTTENKDGNSDNIKVDQLKESNPYSIDKFIAKEKQDSLLVDIITYIYIRPSEATSQNRFDKKFRLYYNQQISQFGWIYYSVDKDATHYFYLIRPARSTKGYKRGVAGKYKLNKNGKITDFEEIFNTPMLPDVDIYERGKEVFEEILKTGGIGRFEGNQAYIEFPNQISVYDKAAHEWIAK